MRNGQGVSPGYRFCRPVLIGRGRAASQNLDGLSCCLLVNFEFILAPKFANQQERRPTLDLCGTPTALAVACCRCLAVALSCHSIKRRVRALLGACAIKRRIPHSFRLSSPHYPLRVAVALAVALSCHPIKRRVRALLGARAIKRRIPHSFRLIRLRLYCAKPATVQASRYS